MTADYQHTFALRAAEILGSPAEADDWLRRPTPAFNGQRPMDLLKTSEGQKLVNRYLTGLECGGGLESDHLGMRGRDFEVGFCG